MTGEPGITEDSSLLSKDLSSINIDEFNSSCCKKLGQAQESEDPTVAKSIRREVIKSIGEVKKSPVLNSADKQFFDPAFEGAIRNQYGIKLPISESGSVDYMTFLKAAYNKLLSEGDDYAEAEVVIRHLASKAYSTSDRFRSEAYLLSYISQSIQKRTENKLSEPPQESQVKSQVPHSNPVMKDYTGASNEEFIEDVRSSFTVTPHEERTRAVESDTQLEMTSIIKKSPPFPDELKKQLKDLGTPSAETGDERFAVEKAIESPLRRNIDNARGSLQSKSRILSESIKEKGKRFEALGVAKWPEYMRVVEEQSYQRLVTAQQYLRSLDELLSGVWGQREITEDDRNSALAANPEAFQKTKTVINGIFLRGAEAIGSKTSILGKEFTVKADLGSSRYGTVFLVADSEGHEVILKQAKSGLGSEETDQFVDETYVLLLLEHAQRMRQGQVDGQLLTPQLLAYGRLLDGGKNPFILMSKAEGSHLTEYTRSLKEPLSKEDSLKIGIQLAKVFEILHEDLGKSCLDFKQDDIFWDQDKKQITYIDWNLLAPSISDIGHGDAKRFIVNIPRDIYLSCQTLYQLLTKESPYAGQEKDRNGDLVVRTDIEQRLQELNIDYSIKQLLAKGLSSNINDRYQSAKEFRHDLEQLLESRS